MSPQSVEFPSGEGAADHFAALIEYPAETLTTELKSWFDPESPEGIAKIVKAAIALRNQNGGFLIVGISNDGSHCPEPDFDVRKKFHSDNIQAIVSRYAFKVFDVETHFRVYKGIVYPVISIPAGFREPCAISKELIDKNGKRLLRQDAVIVRTLSANHSVSSSEATFRDWEGLTHRCFLNREVDIGKFVRRYWPDLSREISNSGEERVVPQEKLADESWLRFQEKISGKEHTVKGWFQISCVLDREIVGLRPSLEFLNRISTSNPRHTGWPLWLVPSHNYPDDAAPYVLNNFWECMLYFPVGIVSHIDFWRISPTGSFYHVRGVEDDTQNERAILGPGEHFDFVVAIWRVTEALSCLLSFYSEFLPLEELSGRTAKVVFIWSGLSGRRLTSWTEPNRLFSGGIATQDRCRVPLLLPCESPRESLPGIVNKIVSELFLVFEGQVFQDEVILEIATECLDRHR